MCRQNPLSANRGGKSGGKSGGGQICGKIIHPRATACAIVSPMSHYQLLIVEDDAALRDVLAEQFKLHREFEVAFIDNAAAAIARTAPPTDTTKAATPSPDLILLDVGLPDQDGRETCKILRKNGVRVPIIMVTGAASDADTILGLDAGANDYIIKPFRFGVLLARIRAQLRHYENSDQAEQPLGGYIFRPAQKMLECQDGSKIRLTEKETGILQLLLRAGGAPVGRQQLLHDVWGYNARVTTHTLETHIYRLRQKMEADPSNAKILLTQEGGYALNPSP